MLARYPEEPTEEQQETLRSYIYLFARLYPWYIRPVLNPVYPMLIGNIVVNARRIFKRI